MHSIRETIVASLTAGREEIRLAPGDINRTDDTMLSQLAQLDRYILDYNSWDARKIPIIRGAIEAGYTPVIIDHQDGLISIYEVDRDSFFVDPNGHDWNHPTQPYRYCGYSVPTTVDKMERLQVKDEESGEMKPKYDPTKLRELISADVKDTQFDRETRPIELTILYHLPTASIYELVKDEIVFKTETPYQLASYTAGDKEYADIRPYLPFSMCRPIFNFKEPYATSVIQHLLEQFKLHNTLNTISADVSMLLASPIITVVPEHRDKIGQIGTVPGAILAIPPGQVDYLTPAGKGDKLLDERLNLERSMRNSLAVDQAVQGLGQGRSHVTSNEIDTQVIKASARHSLFASVLEQDFYRQVITVINKHIAIFFDDGDFQGFTDGGGRVEFDKLDKHKLDGDFRPIVKLGSTLDLKRRETLEQRLQLLEQGRQLPNFDAAKFFTEAVMQHYDADLPLEKLQEYIVEPQDQPEPVINKVATEYEKMEPGIRRQIQERDGFQPAESLELEEEVDMVELEARKATAEAQIAIAQDPSLDLSGQPINYLQVGSEGLSVATGGNSNGAGQGSKSSSSKGSSSTPTSSESKGEGGSS